MLTPDLILPKYLRFLYLSMTISLLFFCIAVELIWLFPFLFIFMSYGYFRGCEWMDKKWEKPLGIFFLFVLVAAGFFTRDALFASAYMLVAFCVTLFYRPRAVLNSHYVLLPLLGLMVLSTSFTASLFYLVFFLLTIYLFSHLLFYFTMYRLTLAGGVRKQEIYHTNYTVSLVAPETRSYKIRTLLTKSLLGVVIVAIIAAGFLLIPRTSWEIRLGRKGAGGKQTGFGNKIENRTVPGMMFNQNVNFTVQTSNQRQPYFKGVVYNRYTGDKWQSDFNSKMSHPVNYNGRSSFIIAKPPDQESFSQLVEDKYNTRDYQGPSLVFRGIPKVITPQMTSEMGNELRISQAGDIKARSAFSTGCIYHVWCDLSEITPACVTPGSGEWKDYYLKLPELSQRVKKLSNRLVEGKKTRKSKVDAVLSYLQGNYTYSLNMNPKDNEWTDYFLFEAKKGFCIHFATAMAVLLRQQNIPTRVVGGFLGKNYDKDNQLYILTSENAHAWVEVYIPEKGWVRFDPTPAQESYLSGLEFWSELYYRIHSWWFNYIVGFSYGQQRAIYRWIKRALAFLLRYSGYLAGPLAIAIFWMFARRRKNKKKYLHRWLSRINSARKDRRQKASDPGYRFYREMLDHLTNLGIDRHAFETPHEFFRKVIASYPTIEPCMSDLTRHFCELRFGHRELESRREQKIRDNLGELANAVQEILRKEEGCLKP